MRNGNIQPLMLEELILDIFNTLSAKKSDAAEQLQAFCRKNNQEDVQLLAPIIAGFIRLEPEKDEAILKTGLEVMRYLFGISTRINFSKAKLLLAMLANIANQHTGLTKSLKALITYLEKTHEQLFV